MKANWMCFIHIKSFPWRMGDPKFGNNLTGVLLEHEMWRGSFKNVWFNWVSSKGLTPSLEANWPFNGAFLFLGNKRAKKGRGHRSPSWKAVGSSFCGSLMKPQDCQVVDSVCGWVWLWGSPRVSLHHHPHMESSKQGQRDTVATPPSAFLDPVSLNCVHTLWAFSVHSTERSFL